MKKQLFVIGMLAFMAITIPTRAGIASRTSSQDPLENIIHLSLMHIGTAKDLPRVPVHEPLVGQNGHTLYFLDEMDFSVNLYFIGEDGEKTLEYSAFVSSEDGILLLPSNLQGTYAIEVIRGEQHFWGEIELD